MATTANERLRLMTLLILCEWFAIFEPTPHKFRETENSQEGKRGVGNEASAF